MAGCDTDIGAARDLQTTHETVRVIRQRWPQESLSHRLDQAGFLASAILVSGPGNNFPDQFPRETNMIS